MKISILLCAVTTALSSGVSAQTAPRPTRPRLVGVAHPATLPIGLDGNISFMIKHPDGHDIEFVQYLPGSLHSSNFGKSLPPTRVSERMIHVGTTVSDRAAFDALYRDILGFQQFW